MTEITAALVKELREKSGAGMMDCKKALTENNGDMEAAIDWLRAKGIAKADKKADRTAAEGLVAVASGEGSAVIVEVNCETDFAAKNEQFQSLVKNIAEAALATDGTSEAVAAATIASTGKSVVESSKDAVATIGENISFRRSAKLSAGVVAAYVHNAAAPNLGKLAVLVGLETDGDKAAANEFGRKVAMHVASMNPLALSPDAVDPAAAEREKAVLTEQARESGKPEAVIEKMIAGRMDKFFQEVALLKQAFVINPDVTVEQAAKEAGVTVTGFARILVGEGIEKEESDFAAEVAAAAKG